MSPETRFLQASFPAVHSDLDQHTSHSDQHGFGQLSLPSHDQGQRALRANAQGHAAGYTAGMRAANDELEKRSAELAAGHAALQQRERTRVDGMVTVLAAAARALDERDAPALADIEDVLIAAAVELAEAILGYELDRTDNSARAALDRALVLADPAVEHTVRMHPDDLAMLAMPGGVSGIAFTADSSLSRGDAVTEFPDGYLDARIHTALARAKDILQGGAR